MSRWARRSQRLTASGWRPQSIHQQIQRAAGKSSSHGRGSHRKDADKARGGVFGADVSAKLIHRTASVEDEVLKVIEVTAPQAGPGQLRVRVTAAGLNPMDWFMTADAATAARFGLSLPVGFGTDYAGVVDQVGEGVTGFAAGDRVFGGALSRAVADFVVVDAAGGIAANEAHHTPDGVDDRSAASLTIAGRTASAASHLADLIATGRLRVPIAASFALEQIRSAVELQSGRHVKGKVVIDL